MKIVVLHGQERRGSTWHITKQLMDALSNRGGTDILEFFFNDHHPCAGCFSCFKNGEDTCPHYSENKEIMSALETADVLVIQSPNYCMGMTGQLKVFMDHMAYRWMSHRPHPAMFHKVGVVISTTAGTGAGRVTRGLKQQLFYWGIAKVYQIPVTVNAMGWEDVSDKIKAKIDKKVKRTAANVLDSAGKVKPGVKTKFVFSIMGGMQRGNTWMPKDRAYWDQKGWLGKGRPWR